MRERSLSVVLDLEHHCVETEARRLHRRLTDRLLEEGLSPEEMEGYAAKLKLLEDFVRNRNFRKMRAEDPDMAGGRPVALVLFRGPDDRVCWEKRRRL